MGVKFSTEDGSFVFDFEHDGAADVVRLTGSGYQVEAFGKCFYYGYEFSEQVDSKVRSAFIQYVKFHPSLKDNPDLTRFVQKAVNNLNDKINLYDYDMVVMPQSSSRVNQYMLRYIYRFAQPSLYYMHLLKFANERDEKLCASIRNNNILVVDDIATSGSTINEILRTLRIINEDNKITVFSLIGRQDLMADQVGI